MKPRKPTQQELEDIFRTPDPEVTECAKDDKENGKEQRPEAVREGI